MSAAVSLPAIFRRKLGDLRIDAAPLGGDRVGFVVEGPPAAVAALAKGLRCAKFMVETYDNDPGVLYAESGAVETDEVTKRYTVDVQRQVLVEARP